MIALARRFWEPVVLVSLLLVMGCGSTKSRLATEQLVMSDAVDRAVSEIDFRPLTARKVFLDTKYAVGGKTATIVNTDYIISSVRQQLVAADCRLVDTVEESEVIVELRIGTLGTDANEVVYGMPASNAVSGAAALVPNAPLIPPIPEISLARREAQLGAAKIAMFAYDRQTRRPVWQSGIARAKSTAQDMWILGAGPFQRGSNVEGTQFAGTRLQLPHLKEDGTLDESLPVEYGREHLFQAPAAAPVPSMVKIAGFVNEVPAERAGAENGAPADGGEQPAASGATEAPPAPAAGAAPAEGAADNGSSGDGARVHVTDQKK